MFRTVGRSFWLGLALLILVSPAGAGRKNKKPSSKAMQENKVRDNRPVITLEEYVIVDKTRVKIHNQKNALRNGKKLAQHTVLTDWNGQNLKITKGEADSIAKYIKSTFGDQYKGRIYVNREDPQPSN